MYDKLTKVNWIFVVLILLGLRTLADANFAQALVITALCGLVGWKDYLKSKEQPPLSEEVQRQLDEVKSTVGGLAMRSASRPAQMEESIKRFF